MENDIREDDESLLALASMIDEDQPIDWDSEEGEAQSDDERAVLAELRVLAALTRVYRDPEAAGPETELQPGMAPHRLPTTWGQLTVLEPVGMGGFARVYRARDALNRNVALKLFPITPENASALASRVLREGSLLAKVKHANVVVVHGVDQSKEFVGLWMEFIPGRTMEAELRARGPLSAEEATPIGVDLCRALAAVHGRGLVHRDVKAQNVMREDGGRTVLMDFGAGTELATGLGKPADTAGTPLYLAPELFDGRPATRASDIYSLGVLLYRMVTREYPVEGGDRTEIGRAHRAGQVKRLRDARPDLPSRFIEAVERALSPDPEARPQTAGEFEAALTSGRHDGRRDRDWTWWPRAAAIAAAVVLVALPVWWIVRDRGAATSPNSSPAAAADASPASPPTVDPKLPFTVEAEFVRTRNSEESRLTPTSSLATGDQLAMEITTSADAYVYVLNADDTGKTNRLFPLDAGPAKPLSAAKTHRLPSNTHDWTVTSDGGREHFVIMVTTTLNEAADLEARTIPAAVEGAGVTRTVLSANAIGVLRSVGGLAPRKPIAQTAAAPSLLWFEDAADLSDRREKANGAWTRRLTVRGSAR